MKEEDKFKEALSKVISLETTDTRIIERIIKKYRYFPFFNYPQFLREIGLSHNEANELILSNGYKNFTEMQSKMTEVILEQLSAIEKQSIDEDQLSDEEITRIIRDLAELEINNINHMISSFSIENINRLVKDLSTSPEIIIIANRISVPIATYASNILNRIGINVKTITSADTCSFDTIPNYDRSSLVLAIGFWRYPKDTLKLMNYFKRKNFKIVAITDNKESPLSHLAEYSLFVRGASLIYTDSFTNVLILLNTITIALYEADKRKVLKRLYEFEDTAKNLDYYF